MTAPVNSTPSVPAFAASVLNGRPVLGTDWIATARAIDYVRGRGGVLVPAYDPVHTINVADLGTATATDFHFRVMHREPCFARVWVLGMYQSTAPTYADGAVVAVSAPAGGTPQNFSLSGASIDASDPVVFIERLSAVVVGEQDVTLRIEFANTIKGAGGKYGLYSVGCFELPRADLNVVGTGADGGVDIDTLRALQVIYDGPAGQSVAGVGDALTVIEAQSMRPGLMAWDLPDDYAVTTVAVWADFFPSYPPTYAHIMSGATKAVLPRVRAKVDVGTVGEVRVTTRLGATTTISITGTAFGYVDGGTVALDAEDLSTADGRRSGASEAVRWEWRRVSGAGNLYVSGLYLIDG